MILSIARLSSPSKFPSSMPSPSPSLTSKPSSSIALLAEIDYQDFENDSFGPYWGPWPGVKAAEIKDKYQDALDSSIDKGFGVKLKEDAALYTQQEIVTVGYSTVRLEFYLIFKKMIWDEGDKFWFEVERNDNGIYSTVMLVGLGETDEDYADNNEPNWFFIRRDVPVDGASSMRLRLRMNSIDKGETHLDHVKILLG